MTNKTSKTTKITKTQRDILSRLAAGESMYVHEYTYGPSYGFVGLAMRVYVQDVVALHAAGYIRFGKLDYTNVRQYGCAEGQVYLTEAGRAAIAPAPAKPAPYVWTPAPDNFGDWPAGEYIPEPRTYEQAEAVARHYYAAAREVLAPGAYLNAKAKGCNRRTKAGRELHENVLAEIRRLWWKAEDLRLLAFRATADFRERGPRGLVSEGE